MKRLITVCASLGRAEILLRLPMLQILAEYVHDILEVISELVVTDNEEVALLSLRMQLELHRTFRKVQSVEPELMLFEVVVACLMA